MNALLTYWQNNGTKLLGVLIAINSGIAGGSVVLPPPLGAHSAVIIPWAVFINMILGVVVAGRGFGNTQAIAAVVMNQHAQAVTAAVATNTAPVLAPPGKIAPVAKASTP